LIAAAATMLAVVMIAGAVPARRAARIDPLRAIRTE
jgi:ABC-type antimicrobial peptide transport system permease subunit